AVRGDLGQLFGDGVEAVGRLAVEVERRDLVDDGAVDPRRVVVRWVERGDAAVLGHGHEGAGAALAAVAGADGPVDVVLAGRGVLGNGECGRRVAGHGQLERGWVIRVERPGERERGAAGILKHAAAQLDVRPAGGGRQLGLRARL